MCPSYGLQVLNRATKRGFGDCPRRLAHGPFAERSEALSQPSEREVVNSSAVTF
jgi:hypothetical protein